MPSGQPMFLRVAVSVIAGRWSPIAWLGDWYGQVLNARIREVFFPDKPLTWADLNPFHRSEPKPLIEMGPEPDDAVASRKPD
jgi:hypothetical protein